MKKIMFNDKYGLTEAVLEGRKTMTRRIVPEKQLYYIRRHFRGLAVMEAPFKYDEVVAVAQNYKDAGFNCLGPMQCPGYFNKMFVKAGLMPHQIRITNVRVERLQEITDADCKREGIDYIGGYSDSYYFGHGVGDLRLGNSYRDAFAALIDKVSGKGTWASNPWVFVYEFELVK